MPNEPIEELYVSIGADVSKLLTDTKKGVAEAEKELKKFGDTAEDALGPANIDEFLKKTAKLKEEVQKAKEKAEELGEKFKQSGEKAKTSWGGVNQVFSKLKVMFGVIAGFLAGQKIVGFFQNIGSAAIAANAQFETFQTQFETMLGSASAAQQRIDELAEFGVKTPFELPEIVQASRMLEMFGGAALSTGDNLTMIGDIAAGVNQPFADVAMWIGRMYDAMQAGRPFGEASMRLQEMGALSGQARAELEKLQKEGASGTVMWEKFNELVGDKFAGNMERLSATFQGVMSNLQDFQGMLLREGGEAFFGQIRDDAKELLDIISTEDMSGAIVALAKALGQAAAMATELATTPLLDSLKEMEPEKIQQLADAVEDTAKALAEYAELDTTADINGLIDVLTSLLDSITAVTNTANRLKSTLETVGIDTKPLKDIFINILFPVYRLALFQELQLKAELLQFDYGTIGAAMALKKRGIHNG
jgi:hypothetical protein